MVRTIAAFWMALASAVVASVFTLAAMAMGVEAFEPQPRFSLKAFDLKFLGVIKMFVAAIAVLPAAIAVSFVDRTASERRTWRYAIWGAVTGGVAISALLVFRNPDLANRWVLEALLSDIGYIPAFALAGFIGGAAFGKTRRLLLK